MRSFSDLVERRAHVHVAVGKRRPVMQDEYVGRPFRASWMCW